MSATAGNGLSGPTPRAGAARQRLIRALRAAAAVLSATLVVVVLLEAALWAAGWIALSARERPAAGSGRD